MYNYRFYKNDELSEAAAGLEKADSSYFTVYEEEKCLRTNESAKYRGKSFTEMLETLNGYDIKY